MSDSYWFPVHLLEVGGRVADLGGSGFYGHGYHPLPDRMAADCRGDRMLSLSLSHICDNRLS